MGKCEYRKLESSYIQGICVKCEKNLQKQKGKKKGKQTYGPLCHTCSDKRHGIPSNGIPSYKKYKKDKCEYCGFVPIHSCQLDVDHIDQDHKNNDPENLQTLCANCHRLKTYLERQTV